VNSVEAALEAIYAVLETVAEVRLYRDPAAVIDPPGVTVGPPRLQRRARGSAPTDATFQVAVVVGKNPRAMTELLRLEPLVVDAIDALPAGSVGDSAPGTWSSGGMELPAYLIDFEYAL
jgi:hypothetical protein